MPPRRLKTVLKKLREEDGMSMADLAVKADVTDAYIATLETGKRANPSLEVLKRPGGGDTIRVALRWCDRPGDRRSGRPR